MERRVPEAIREATADVIVSARVASAGASDHLTNAWRLESAAGRLVEPNNKKATLGTIIRAIRAEPDRWWMAITDPTGSSLEGTPVVELMDLLWKGQTDRHGANPTIPVTLEAAQAAVHVAVLLVQWWTSGGVTNV